MEEDGEPAELTRVCEAKKSSGRKKKKKERKHHC
jgi:hypothetical protein